MTNLFFPRWLLVGMLAGALAASASAQVLPTIRAFSSHGGDSADTPVVSLPDEVSKNGSSGTSSSSARSAILDDFRLQQVVSATGANGTAYAYADFKLQGDRLTFTETGATRAVRLNWEVLYDPFVTSTFAFSSGGIGSSPGGSQSISLRVDGQFYNAGSNFPTGALQTGFFSFTDVFGTSFGDITPTSSTGMLDFDLLAGQTLELTFSLVSNSSASGSATNAVSGTLSVNTRFWLEILTPEVELLSTSSLFPTYGAALAAVPEPSTSVVLAGLGVLALAGGRRRKPRPLPVH